MLRMDVSLAPLLNAAFCHTLKKYCFRIATNGYQYTPADLLALGSFKSVRSVSIYCDSVTSLMLSAWLWTESVSHLQKLKLIHATAQHFEVLLAALNHRRLRRSLHVSFVNTDVSQPEKVYLVCFSFHKGTNN